MKKFQKGFTLVELLVVIGILAILTAVVLVAVNPGRQLAQARNTQRAADVNAILTAITAYMADPVNKGVPPTTITAVCPAVQKIGATADPLVYADISALTPTYIAALPMDPTTGIAPTIPSDPSPDTGYTVCTTGAAGANRMTVCAPTIESPATTAVCVTR